MYFLIFLKRLMTFSGTFKIVLRKNKFFSPLNENIYTERQNNDVVIKAIERQFSIER